MEEEITVLKYKGQIRSGGYGFYVNFDTYNDSHWQITYKIGKYFNIVPSNHNSTAVINWETVINLFKTRYPNIAVNIHCRFPEFKDKELLKEFVDFLNNDLRFTNSTNFINLKYIV